MPTITRTYTLDEITCAPVEVLPSGAVGIVTSAYAEGGEVYEVDVELLHGKILGGWPIEDVRILGEDFMC